MNDLLEALELLAKYQVPTDHPTNCEHDVLTVVNVYDVTDEDTKRLNELGFNRGEEETSWHSFRFGSC